MAEHGIRDDEMDQDPFAAIMVVAATLDVTNIKELPGCWEHRVDEHWWFALNGHREPTACSKGNAVDPFTAYVEFNGWPAGIFGPIGDGIFAAGVAANPKTFADAIRRSLGLAVAVS